jgi:predicted RNase H-like nuclease
VSDWIAGVDGCREGWIVARRELGHPSRIDIEVHARFATLLDPKDPPVVIAVDMPIGLPDRIGEGGRGPEQEVRRYLGRRKSSVFPIPSRSAIYAKDYATSCQRAARTSAPSRKVSKQAFNIFPKMREIDALLRVPPKGSSPKGSSPIWRERVFEVHPELAFWRLNGERELLHAKKARDGKSWLGKEERIAILTAQGIADDVLRRSPPRGSASDDMLDALALLCIAQRIREGRARPFPDPFARDKFGLPIAIWA